ncbi:CPBP family intramembrane glutamic endopeptidase [Paenibacillus sp. 1011MAR3C5]|uniref:CPBP family intramembrane glutamic endopeptidase n=1 Tax=Paenibacillus sp. 1011MAR3C5 TaxID=1675787 RepID=UPI0037C8DBF9
MIGRIHCCRIYNLIQCAAEEILFRGYMYRMFRSLKGGAFWSIFIATRSQRVRQLFPSFKHLKDNQK